MTFPIPNPALDDRFAIVGTTGSGKTYLSSSAVEILMASGKRVIVVDPLGVWWGLRLAPDGVKPSPYKPVVFGGSLGDLSIHEQSGSVIGETVAGMAESCIVDLSQIGNVRCCKKCCRLVSSKFAHEECQQGRLRAMEKIQPLPSSQETV